MRKIMLALTLLLVLCLPTAALAQTRAFDVNGAMLSVFLPDTWYVFTRDTPVDARALQAYFGNWDTLNEQMKKNSVYAVAINPATGAEFHIQITHDDNSIQVNDMSALTDGQIQRQLIDDGSANTAKKNGATVFELRTAGKYKYVYEEFGAAGAPQTALYLTIVNGDFVSLSINTKAAALSVADLSTMKNIMDGVSLHGVSTAPSPLVFIPGIAALAGALIAGLLIFLLLRRKKTPLLIPQARYDSLNRFGGVLAWMLARVIIGALVQFGSLAQASGWILLLQTAALLMLGTVAVLMFLRSPAFPAAYVFAVLFLAVSSVLVRNYAVAVGSLVGESLFIIYLFQSARVAILYRARRVEVDHPKIQTVLTVQAPEPAAADDVLASLRALKQVNPTAYRRNVVALAMGYRDFRALVAATPGLNPALAQGADEEALNRVATAYGRASFEEWFLACLQKLGPGAGQE